MDQVGRETDRYRLLTVDCMEPVVPVAGASGCRMEWAVRRICRQAPFGASLASLRLPAGEL